jgi:hypothetical protein
MRIYFMITLLTVAIAGGATAFITYHPHDAMACSNRQC